MVGTPYGLNDPTKPHVREPNKCIVKGCENNADPGSVTMLCVQCCHVVATGDMVWYYANYTGKNWISDTVMKIAHLKQDRRDLQDEVDELKKDIKEAYILENDDVLSLNDLRTFYHEHKRDSAVEEEQRDIIIRLRNEINALNYNMDHAYNLGDGKFLTLDDLHNFYEDNKNIHDVVRQQHNRILLLGLELKALQKPKEETFSTMPRQEFEKRAEAAALKAAENAKFDTYTEGFRKGFDLGYEKAKDQYYE